MLKFSKRLKNLSKQKITLYGVFRTVTDEERPAYEAEVLKNLPPETDPAKAEFAKAHALVTVITSKEQFEQFATAYYIQQHWDHFEKWCPLHGFESTETPGAVDAYYQTCLSDEPLGSDLQVLTWTYDVDEIARIMRMFFACVPVNAPYEAENQMEFNYFTQNVTMAVRECIQSFSLDQLTAIIQHACSKEICDAAFGSATAPIDEPAAPAEAPKKKGRPKKTDGGSK